MKERDKLEDLDVDGGISEWLLKGHDGWTWVGFIWPGIG
jgi:hypothetical protein